MGLITLTPYTTIETSGQINPKIIQQNNRIVLFLSLGEC